MRPAVLLLALFAAAAVADTPANCTFEEVRGQWTFYMAPGSQHKSVNCSTEYSVNTQYSIELLFPDVAVDSMGNRGFWTLIYNQGFEVVINNMKFFAFSFYESEDKSICSQTFSGWYHTVEGEDWGCYYGQKSVGGASLSPLARSPLTEADYRRSRNLPMGRTSRLYQRDDEFVNKINSAQSLWKAKVYDELLGMPLSDVQARAGSTVRPIFSGMTHKPAPALTTTQFPKSFDWRDVNGVNFVSPVREQLKCGSCYAFGSTAMFEARIRILSNNTQQTILSPQEIVSCSEYCQGCDGGFPYLMGKYGEDFGFVAEDCLPYEAIDTDCPASTKNCPRIYAADYHYVGGFYGGCNEQAMIAELVAHGPIAISFEVESDFHAYSGGIYKHTGVSSHFNPFELTNHIVLIVGYGEANGVKYWTAKNSWGTQWGEDGFFRIVRGVDEVSFESIAVAATPIVFA